MLAKIATIVAFIVWCFCCQHWYVCHIKQKCEEPAAVAETPPVEPTTAPDTRPLVFSWAKPAAVTRSAWAAYRDSIVNNLPEGQILEIVGLYGKEETAPENFPNMGMARATKIRELLGDRIADDRVLLVSRLVNLPEDAKVTSFEAANFNYLQPTEEEKATIVEVENRVIIQFPFSSAEKEPDPKVDAYLEKLAQRLSETTETVTITGHTDNVGSDQLNQRLGRARARHIQKILIKKGVSKKRITISSEGESQPVASNDTEEGRRKNRRAELVLNQ